ncbi:MAG: hypothetical protein J5965_16585 [Aeriscardovia sp.]|nr:hypothetical protein [Aeriscardovia sp.]
MLITHCDTCDCSCGRFTLMIDHQQECLLTLHTTTISLPFHTSTMTLHQFWTAITHHQNTQCTSYDGIHCSYRALEDDEHQLLITTPTHVRLTITLTAEDSTHFHDFAATHLQDGGIE